MYESFDWPMLIILFPMFWLANIGSAHWYGHWQYKKHMLKTNRFLSILLFLSLKKNKFSWWVILQQTILYVMIAIFLLSWIFNLSIPISFFRFYVFRGVWLIYLLLVIDACLFDNSDKFV